MSDFVTVLRSAWDEARAYKYWPRGAKEPHDYKLGTHFIGAQIPCASIQDLFEILKDLQDEDKCIIVRGALADSGDPRRRSFSSIEDDEEGLVRHESPLVALDVDSARPPEGLGFTDSVVWLREQLGGIWQTTACVAQATGTCYSPDFRCRLWYWADKGIGDLELRARLRGLSVKVDVSVCTGTQPIYTAPPRFDDPKKDPFKGRERVFYIEGNPALAIHSLPCVEAVDIPDDLPAIVIERQWTRMELLGCDREMDRWEDRLEACRVDRPNLLLKAASRLARLVAHGWSDRETVERRLIGAYAASYSDETEDGTREAGIDPDTLEEAIELVGKGFKYAKSNPEIIKPPKGLKEIDLKKARSARNSAVKNIKDNASLIGVFAPTYAEQIAKGIITHDKAVAELRNAMIDAGVGGSEAQEHTEKALKEAVVQHQKQDAGAWMEGLQLSESGQVKNLLGNITRILSRHPATRDVFVYNERTLQVLLVKQPPWASHKPVPRPMEDRDAVMCAEWLISSQINMADAKESVVYSAMTAIAQNNSIDPFKEYLKELEWDGEKRLDEWLMRYAGAEDTPFVRLAGAKTLISAVARAFEPGCQVDTMLILEGSQGAMKTSLIRTLLAKEEWYSAMTVRGGDKDTTMQFHGPVLLEMPDLSQLKGWDIEHTKAMIANRVDRFRPPFGRTMAPFARRSIFFGTTNEDVYLKDVTGNRRFWPVYVTSIDLPCLKEIRDQLWAEAVAHYTAGTKWWLTPEEEALARDAQEDRREKDPVEEQCEIVLSRRLTEKQKNLFPEIQVDAEGRPTAITTRELAGLLPNFEYDKSGQIRLGAALKGLGWKLRRMQAGGKRDRRYTRS